MTILTQAFVLSIDTFSGLKGIGDMQENLRAGANQLRYDLTQGHFEGMRRTSDPNFSTPVEGFLRIYQQAASTSEGTDSDGVPSARANLTNSNVLHLACRLKGNQQQSFYSTQVIDGSGIFFAKQTFYNLDPTVNPPASAPADATLTVYPIPPSNPGFFRSQWAEVAYFLALTGTTEEPLNPNGTTGTQLFGLYRAQFVAVTEATNINALIPNSNASGFPGIACVAGAGNLVFYTPKDFAKGAATRTFNPANPTTRSASLVVPNVLSFLVQGIVPGANPADGNYDSAIAGQPSLQGLSISLRVWDNKTRQARQITIMQDL
jgi:hypothetical protein